MKVIKRISINIIEFENVIYFKNPIIIFIFILYKIVEWFSFIYLYSYDWLKHIEIYCVCVNGFIFIEKLIKYYTVWIFLVSVTLSTMKFWKRWNFEIKIKMLDVNLRFFFFKIRNEFKYYFISPRFEYIYNFKNILSNFFIFLLLTRKIIKNVLSNKYNL